MKKRPVIHPFLFAVYPILFLFSYNKHEVFINEIIFPIVFVLFFTLLLWLLFSLILRNKSKAGLIVSLSLMLFYSYGHFYNVIYTLRIVLGRIVIGPNKVLFPLWCTIFFLGTYFTARTRRNLFKLIGLLNMVAVVLVVIPLVDLGVYFLKTRVSRNSNRAIESREVAAARVENTAVYRDVYYIILDGYASSSTLKEIYDYDNREFIDCLNEKGFYIASKSFSNYATTFLSLVSSLNMEYINYLTEVVGEESRDRRIPYQMIKDSKAMNFLKSKGYKIIHFSAGYTGTYYNEYADLNIQCGLGTEFLYELIKTTILYRFTNFKWLFINRRRKNILSVFDKFTYVCGIKGPKYVFAHIICPHPPFLFDANIKDPFPAPQQQSKM